MYNEERFYEECEKAISSMYVAIDHILEGDLDSATKVLDTIDKELDAVRKSDRMSIQAKAYYRGLQRELYFYGNVARIGGL